MLVEALKIKGLFLSLPILIGLIVCFHIPVAVASPDVYLKDSPASGVTTNPGKLMDFTPPTRVEPAYLATSSGIEYFWYSPPYVGTIPGPRGHSFHLYYNAAVAMTINITVYVAVQPDGGGIPSLVSSKTYPLEATSSITHVIIPDVIIIPEMELSGERIKLSLSTEDPITIYFDSIATPSVLNYIPPDSIPVGGYFVSINKLAIIAPYLTLVGLVGATSTFFAMRKLRKAQTKSSF